MSKSFAIRGTIVAAVATKEGLLIAADRRTSDQVHGVLDNKTKIIRLLRTTAFSSTGTSKFHFMDRASGEDRGKAFDADEIVANYFDNINFENTDDFWKGLTRTLRNDFKGFLSHIAYDDWPESGDIAHNNEVFQLVFLYVDENGVIGITDIQFCYIKGQPPTIKFMKGQYASENFKRVDPYVAGNTNVFFEVRDGTDGRFDDIRTDQSVMRLWKGLPDVETVSVEEAETFCRKLIKATSECDLFVGPTYDAAILNHQDEFRWLSQNKSVDEVERQERE
jgi:hypothetical protein